MTTCDIHGKDEKQNKFCSLFQDEWRQSYLKGDFMCYGFLCCHDDGFLCDARKKYILENKIYEQWEIK